MSYKIPCVECVLSRNIPLRYRRVMVGVVSAGIAVLGGFAVSVCCAGVLKKAPETAIQTQQQEQRLAATGLIESGFHRGTTSFRAPLLMLGGTD
jgi:hypothetical protein